MHPRYLRIRHWMGSATAGVTVALLIAALAGCASQLTPKPADPRTHAAPYVGVFTGEFVEGKPLYRFPTIEVVGSRSSIGPGT